MEAATRAACNELVAWSTQPDSGKGFAGVDVKPAQPSPHRPGSGRQVTSFPGTDRRQRDRVALTRREPIFCCLFYNDKSPAGL